ncbi:Na+/H+ antiporter subunit E [Corynebacterium sp. TAE3-ERU12]|uniref:Na+/H+ antiporter subunit E n=1 Tax=Corynebacterium sp. TAE3-ERU12 TaxID=2849491 RepID=UPI001C49676D|nr:Na+/H+ antiporter subunit E [Corynebacterium sp. TAE3-ERU12]MBV7295958.1 Na+/H+ antiporter subunit E [Corynebacterium sp. TAE3-ERU12]
MRDTLRRNKPPIVMFTWLVLLWLLLVGEVTVGNIVAGVGIAAVVALVLPMPRVPTGGLDVNWPAMATLLVSFTVEFITASCAVAWLAMRRSAQPCGAVVQVPMRTRDDLTLASAVALISLQPGGLVMKVDRQHHLLTIHILDASTTGRVDRAVGKLAAMERRVVRAFENRDVNATSSRFGHDHAQVHREDTP